MTEHLHSQLERYFSPQREKYTDRDFDSIAELLSNTIHAEYSKSPRLYTLTRILGNPNDLDDFLKQKLSDSSLPFRQTQLPSAFREGWKTRFLELQSRVCDDSAVIKLIGVGKHMTFAEEPAFLVSKRVISRGERSNVDKVFCTLGEGRYYARKKFHRYITTFDDAAAGAAFLNEVENMRLVVHHHCIELIASYTDSLAFVFIMSPVADCNLATYLTEAVESDDKKSYLQEFFGCLLRGLWYIHRQKLRHRDIKPENILLLNNKVLFTDFDCSYNWTHTNRSTTTKIPPRTWKYASPEVAHFGLLEKTGINSSSDIWSLGCVFLEIMTVLKGRSLDQLSSFFGDSPYYSSSNQLQQWLAQLRGTSSNSSLDVAMECIGNMLCIEAGKRLTAHQLSEKTARIPNPAELCCTKCLREGSQKSPEVNSKASDSDDAPLSKDIQQSPTKMDSGSTTLVTPDAPDKVLHKPSHSRRFSQNGYLFAVCREVGKDWYDLTDEERAMVLVIYKVYRKEMLAAGCSEDE